MSHTSMVKLGRIFDGLDSLRPGFTYFQRGALRLMPGSETPVVIDHQMSRRVGFVRELFEHPDTDGPWVAALVTITDAPTWLKRGTPASISYHGLQRQAIGDSERILSGLIPEVSVLSPGRRPAEPGAQVATFGPTQSSSPPAPRKTTATATAGEFYGGGLIKRSRDHEAEDAELRRRLEWAERHLGRVDFETILTNLQVELGYQSDLSRRGVR